MRERYRAIDAAFGGYPHALHYALKANSTLAIARLLRELGSSADANSIWEIEVARRAGFAPSQIVFTGVGKSADELEARGGARPQSDQRRIGRRTGALEAIGSRLGRPVRVAIRVNPDIDAKSHPHISTGLKINKFGVPLDDARDAAADRDRAAVSEAGRRPRARRIADHVARSAAPRGGAGGGGERRSCGGSGVPIEYVDVGGGLGISYDGGDVPSSLDYVTALVDAVRHTSLPIVHRAGPLRSRRRRRAHRACHRRQAADGRERVRHPRRRA